MIQAFLLLSKLIDRLVQWLVMIILSVLVILVITAVFYRYVLSDSITWSAEVARYLCIWVSLMAASIALRRQMHIGVTFFTDRLSPRARRWCTVGIQLAIIIFLVTVAYLGFQLSGRQMRQTSPALMMPMGIPYLAIPISAVLMALQSLTILVSKLLGKPVEGGGAK